MALAALGLILLGLLLWTAILGAPSISVMASAAVIVLGYLWLIDRVAPSESRSRLQSPLRLFPTRGASPRLWPWDALFRHCVNTQKRTDRGGPSFLAWASVPFHILCH